MLRTIWKLGLANTARVAAYRFKCRSGLYRIATPIAVLPKLSSVLRTLEPRCRELDSVDTAAIVACADRLVRGEMQYYDCHWMQVGSPPNWFTDPWSNRTWVDLQSHWSGTREFFAPGMDVKAIWEPSRFEWMVLLARAYAVTSRREFLSTLAEWLDDWIDRNPVNAGVNWKCGQEASIRLMRFLEALEYLEGPPTGLELLCEFVAAHLRRIQSTLSYALSQQNNHGTTEAAALFIGGAWLSVCGTSDVHRKIGALARLQGIAQLTELIEKLVMPDGGFSQHSVNYHRMVLDTLCLVEMWRRRFSELPVLDRCAERIGAAIDWLWALVDPVSGDAPNLGANDGTKLLISPATSYRDHRPTLQLASALFRGQRLYGPGPWDDVGRWWRFDTTAYPLLTKRPQSQARIDSGIVTLHSSRQRTWALLRAPTFQFRPSQADGLHLDVWIDGENVVRDTGSYCYNPADDSFQQFAGTRGHSTCEFDARDQMPRHSKFLFGDWLKPDELEHRSGDGSRVSAVSAYTDYRGSKHRRSVELSSTGFTVRDELSGISERAVIRWYLAPGTWHLSGNTVRRGGIELCIESNREGLECRLSHGWESRCYMQRTAVPMLEAVVPAPDGVVTTTILATQ